MWCTLSVCFESQATVAWSFLLVAVSERHTQRASGVKHFHLHSSAKITIKLYKQNLSNCLQFWFIQSKNLSDQMHCPQTPLGYHSPVMCALKAKQFMSLKKGAKTFSGTNVRLNPPMVYSRTIFLIETGTTFAFIPILCYHACTMYHARLLCNLCIILEVHSKQSCNSFCVKNKCVLKGCTIKKQSIFFPWQLQWTQ